MPKPRRSSDRLFVAIYPPPAAAARLLGAVESLQVPASREVAPEQVHLTLQFIGERDRRELPDVVGSVARSVAGVAPFLLKVIRIAAFPPEGLPRVIAAETDAPPGMLEVQRRLAQRLARNARERAGDRFRPHMTLVRLRPTTSPPSDFPPIPVVDLAFPVSRIVLMASELSAGGARHREVQTFELEV